MRLSNYLFFTTRCADALDFYTQCGLGRVVEVIHYGDKGMPAGSPNMRGKIMHAKFEGKGILFYASDNDDAEPMRGSAHLLELDSRAEVDDFFKRLSAGANVTTPLAVQPWQCYFGKLTDKFGVQWMLSTADV